MRRLLALLIVLSLLLSSCSGNSDASKNNTVIKTDAVEEIVHEVKEIKIPSVESSLFTFDTVTDDDISTLINADSYDDLIAASPFYTSEGYMMQFEDLTYFMDREVAIFDIITDSMFLELDSVTLMLSLDSLQESVLGAYDEFLAYDDSLRPYYEVMLEDYSDEILYQSVLLSQIETLAELEEDDYTQAWSDYIVVQKRLELARRTIQFYARLVTDAVLLIDEYKEDTADDLWLSVIIEFLELDLDYAESYDDQVTTMFETSAKITESLKNLDKADAYASLSLLINMNAVTYALEAPLKELEVRDGLDDDMILLANDANTFMYEMTLTLGANLVVAYDLDAEFLTDSLETKNKSGFGTAMLLPSTFLDSDKTIISNRDKLTEKALKNASDTLSKKRIPLKKPVGFINTVATAVRQTPGILIEKTSSFFYKSFFNVFAKAYDLDDETIEKESKRVDKEEYSRIQAGEAGSETIKTSIKYVEKVENSIGELAEEELGSDSYIAKTIKYSTQFTIGYFTGGAKGLMKLMDSKATPGELGKAAIDVALTIVGSTGKAGSMAKTANTKATTFLGKTANSVSKFMKKHGGRALTGVKKVLTKTKDAVGSVFSKVKNFFGGSPKIVNAMDKTVKAASNGLSKVTEGVKNTYSIASKNTSKLYNKVSTKIKGMNDKLRSIDKSMIIDGNAKEVFGKSMSGVGENFLLGQLFNKIPNFIDNTLPEMIVGIDTDTTETADQYNEEDITDSEETSDNSSDTSNDEISDSSNESSDEELIDSEEVTDTDETYDNSTEELTTSENEDTTSTPSTDNATENIDDTNSTIDVAMFEGSYKGTFLPSEVAGIMFNLDDGKSKFEMTFDGSNFAINSYLAEPRLEGSNAFYFSKFDFDDSTVTLVNIDDEGDKQVFNITFDGTGGIKGTITLYDGLTTAFGKLNLIGDME